MYKNKTFLTIIPARGGSKRLPKKNILDLAGKPLVAWTIEAGIKSKYTDKVVVSSDDDEILKISMEYEASTIKRPPEIANDTATTFDAVKHTLENFRDYDYVVLLQPTSPLRDEKEIDKAIELLHEKDADCIVSVCEVEHPVQWNMKLGDDACMDEFISNLNTKRSQEQEKHYRLNGAIYICKTDKLLDKKSFFLSQKVFAYVMSKENSIDIDDAFDFKIASALIKKVI